MDNPLLYEICKSYNVRVGLSREYWVVSILSKRQKPNTYEWTLGTAKSHIDNGVDDAIRKACIDMELRLGRDIDVKLNQAR